jgi:hypothetical protein
MAMTVWAALSLPSSASAVWQDDHETLQENADIQLVGQFKYQDEEEITWAECQVVIQAQLTAGTTTAHVKSFDVAEFPEKCKVSWVTEVYGCKKITAITESLPLTVHATGTRDLTVLKGFTQYHMEGGVICPKTMSGTPGSLFVQFNTEGTWATGSISGGQAIDWPPREPMGISFQGLVTILPSGTYGVA